MPRVKVLKGVAHNVGSSFTSLMNYAVDDYSMGHILRFARESGIDTLTMDLLNARGAPDRLLQEPLSELPNWYAKMFFRLVESAGSDRTLVRSATLTLTYDLCRRLPSPIPDEPQSPYTCEVSIVDVRGKEYAARFDGWWYREKMRPQRPVDMRIFKCWNPLTWFRS
jgi:hypothetical protein